MRTVTRLPFRASAAGLLLQHCAKCLQDLSTVGSSLPALLGYASRRTRLSVLGLTIELEAGSRLNRE
jgi:hypothetical protein